MDQPISRATNVKVSPKQKTIKKIIAIKKIIWVSSQLAITWFCVSKNHNHTGKCHLWQGVFSQTPERPSSPRSYFVPDKKLKILLLLIALSLRLNLVWLFIYIGLMCPGPIANISSWRLAEFFHVRIVGLFLPHWRIIPTAFVALSHDSIIHRKNTQTSVIFVPTRWFTIQQPIMLRIFSSPLLSISFSLEASQQISIHIQ